MSKQLARRLTNGFAILLVAGLLAAGALIGVLRLEHQTAIALPVPTGTFPVGRTIEAWRDTAADPAAPEPGTPRELMVWIWYPAAGATSASHTAPPAEYLPAAWRTELERSRGPLNNVLLTRDLSQVQAHSTQDSEISTRQPSYPVVILRAGAWNGVANYSTLAEDLASHGYVVIGFDAPYRTNVVVFPDGRVMRRTPGNDPERCAEVTGDRESCLNRLQAAWIADTTFVLDRLAILNRAAIESRAPEGHEPGAGAGHRLAGRLDLTRIGIAGHAFGGAVAAAFCREDPRCQAAIDIDGAPRGAIIKEGLRQPLMFLLSDHTRDTAQTTTRQVLANIQSIYDRLDPDRRQRLMIRGASQMTFTDDGALLKSSVFRRGMELFGRLTIDSERQLAVTAYSVRRFFDGYLKESPSGPVTITSPLYPELQPID